MCLYICLREQISVTTRTIFAIFVPVAHGRGSVFRITKMPYFAGFACVDVRRRVMPCVVLVVVAELGSGVSKA